MPLNWTAIEAVGTSGALILGVAAYLGQQRDRRRTQAVLVAAWVEAPAGGSVEVVVRNGSSEPVTDVLLEPFALVTDDLYWQVLPPELTERVPASDEFAVALARFTDSSIGLSFTDSAGRRWSRRTGVGTLRRALPWTRRRRVIRERRRAYEKLSRRTVGTSPAKPTASDEA